MSHTKLFLSLLLIPIFGWFIWHTWNTESTIHTLIASQEKAGESILSDLQTIPSLPMTEDKDSFIMKDDTSDGISIQFANQEDASLGEQDKKDPFTLSFPKDYTKPVEVKLDKDRSIRITDQSNTSFSSSLLSTDAKEKPDTLEKDSFLTTIKKTLGLGKQEMPKTYLSYQSDDERKTLLYAYQKDQGTGEKKLKHWTLYQKGNGLESESYKIEGAKVKIVDGVAQVFYFGDQDLKNQEAQAQVEPSLMERAQRTLAKEMGEDILNSNKTPDFTIPKPYYIDRAGSKTETEWKWDEEKQILSLSFSVDTSLYPLALDPTLQFTAPGQSNSGEVITGSSGLVFGLTLASGDFNADGRIDLAVGAGTSTGAVYIFYQDGSTVTTAVAADVVIAAAASTDNFGRSLVAGDFNTDGKTDLAVGAGYYLVSDAGGVFIFFNDGSYPTTASSADVILTGNASADRLGERLVAGDFNTDGRMDIAVAAYNYSTGTGRVYIFYNDGSMPTTAGTADVTITGEATSNDFGKSLAAGDFDADGKTDLAVGADRYNTNQGRVYLFYNDGSIPTTAATADVTITGAGTNFGITIAAGDLNADGRIDLVVCNVGNAYIFYNDGSIPTTAGTADVTVVGAYGNGFGQDSVVTGDVNTDGRTDFIVSGYAYSGNTGRAYIFYNDGSIPTTADTADILITGESGGSALSRSMAVGDFNTDGKNDLALGANGYASSTGRTYIFYSQNGQVNTNQNITGEGTSDYFGSAFTTGDFNADGKTDLAVGAPVDNTSTGKVYIFYNDGSYPTGAASADVVLTGETTTNRFGHSLTSGDFNADGKDDLAVGAAQYNTYQGRAYLFYGGSMITENASGADVTLTGIAANHDFSGSFTVGDFNGDGKDDLGVSAIQASLGSGPGYVYIFYGGSFITESASGADITLTGEGINSYFGVVLTTGDWNADGKDDLAVSAWRYNADQGRVYLFYGGSMTNENASGADVTINGEGYFGQSLAAGDMNTDGRIDLIVGADNYYYYTGRVYIFYNDGSIPTTAATADVIIGSAGTVYDFGTSLAVGDFNADGRTDLAVGANALNQGTNGATYIFYNDGSFPATGGSADVSISGDASSLQGSAVVTGDWNNDGRDDLVVGAPGYNSSQGRLYFYETRENFAWQLQPLADSTGLRTGTNGTGQEMRITGETGAGQFGSALATGDFNADGKTDLVVGASGYISYTGRVYIFYSDGSLAPSAPNADVVITGNGGYFGEALTAGDWNADGRADLVVGARGASSVGQAYVFWNDGSWPGTAVTADVVITGQAVHDNFGNAVSAGDFNADGKTDLVVGAHQGTSPSPIGMVYIFYNGSIITETTAGADITITGNAVGDYFGNSLATGDFNADGKADLAVGASGYSSNTGRVYIFYNDGSIPTTAATADVTITGQGFFGSSLVAGDMNADGKTDLVAAAIHYGGFYTGRAYIFYNDGSIPTTAATADVIISGQGNQSFSSSLAVGDFNIDGRTDLAVGAYDYYGGSIGYAYIFYNDGSYPAGAATADVTINGVSGSLFGYSLAVGDWNVDGKVDLAVGASGYNSNQGRVYLYTFNDPIITGETTSNFFGYTLTSGDFNTDGKTDLAVGAYGYSTNTGCAYVFYNGSIITENATGADVIITGEATNSDFGRILIPGDFNADGKTDLAVGAEGYSTSTGRVYVFYNASITTRNASTADAIITGETTNNFFSIVITAGDFNADGKIDLAVGARSYSSATGRAYVFYNGSIITENATGADVIITGETTNNAFGRMLTPGDFNSDGKTDLAVGATDYSTSTGRVYVFYNASITTRNASTADVIITGEATSNYFGGLISGDFNADGKTDLVVEATGYSTSTGRVYVFYNASITTRNASTADVIITGEATSNLFGYALTSGDFNADGKTDLVVGASGYSSSTGRVYTFYNGAITSENASGADAIITGQTTSNYLGYALTPGDFNTDGKTDLAVGAYGYSTNTGRVYIYTTEAKVATPEAMTLRGTTKFKGTVKFK